MLKFAFTDPRRIFLLLFTIHCRTTLSDYQPTLSLYAYIYCRYFINKKAPLPDFEQSRKSNSPPTLGERFLPMHRE